VLSALEAALFAQLEQMVASASAALDEATNQESRAENKYDTRSLEASYLAGAQADRVMEHKALLAFVQRAAQSPSPPRGAPGALVQLEVDDREEWIFLCPAGGGASIRCGSADVRLVSQSSPLGRSVIGLEVDDSFAVKLPRGRRMFDILDVL